jgi:hypothetical protein
MPLVAEESRLILAACIGGGESNESKTYGKQHKGLTMVDRSMSPNARGYVDISNQYGGKPRLHV